MTAALLMLSLLLGAETAPAEPFPRTWFWGFPQDLRTFEQMVGKPAPPLMLDHWLNGAVTPEAMKGKVVVIDFFATWCPPCIEGVPKINALHEQWRDKGVIVIGVCTSDVGQEQLPDFVKRHGVNYPVARDPGLKTMKAWNVKTFPTYAVIDRAGKVRAVGLKQAFLSKAVERIVNESP